MITYNEFLPAILGPKALPKYTGYKDNVNAAIATEFSTVGFRFGHSLLSNGVGRNNNDGTDIIDPTGSGTVNLAEDFFDPNLISNTGAIDPFTGHVSTNIGPILKADADNNANETDLLLIDEVRNTLFGPPGAGGTDLAARDIQRARDHGIGTYNQVRMAYRLPAVTKFSSITSNAAVQAELQATYGTVDKIDPFEGMLAEDHLPGADVGSTIKAILVDQFTRLRDGDRFFYLNLNFNLGELKLILQSNTLAKVIEANTDITNLQNNVFFFKASISGSVYLDFDKDDDRNPRKFGDVGLPGLTVNLDDTSGNVLATTTTDISGHYKFTDQTGMPGTGQFTVSPVLPPGLVLTSAEPGLILISRGGINVRGVDFGVDFNVLVPSAEALMALAMTGSLSTAAALARHIEGTLLSPINKQSAPVNVAPSAAYASVVQAPGASYTDSAMQGTAQQVASNPLKRAAPPPRRVIHSWATDLASINGAMISSPFGDRRAFDPGRDLMAGEGEVSKIESLSDC